MKIIDNKLTARHSGQTFEVENRLGKIRENAVRNSDIQIPNGEEFLHLGHSSEYIEAMKKASKRTGNFYGVNFSTETYDVATVGVGASILGAETESFVLTRPPGHHAGYNLPNEEVGLGHCVFNNIAIASKYLRNKGKKVFILDIDLHKGNGTQDILQNEEDIFVFDISRKGGWPWYENNSQNCFNLEHAKGTQDDTYIRALEQVLVPQLEKFQPDIIGISAGFDTNKKDAEDYLQDLEHPEDVICFELTQKSYKKIKEIVSNYSHFAILEGGYNPEVVSEGVEIFTKD
jgi:acetoin utilization deacetylase AcuC-like enzyme